MTVFDQNIFGFKVSVSNPPLTVKMLNSFSDFKHELLDDHTMTLKICNNLREAALIAVVHQNDELSLFLPDESCVCLQQERMFEGKL
jgi:hypothetical protein